MTKKEITLLILGLVVIICAGILNLTNLPTTVLASKNTLFSPLPDLLTSTFTQIKGAYHWVPDQILSENEKIKKPQILSLSAISYDTTTQKMLYARDIKKRLPMASLSKIMTAAIALENESLDKKYTVSKQAAEIGENTMGLTVSENITFEELLYGLILHSGNDAAETIAAGSQFGRDNFVFLMNKKAEELGLTDTNFTNPTGLEGDGNQYSTVYDLLVMTEYALKNETFAKIAATVEYAIPANDTHREFVLYNQTNLLTTYPGVKGIKTGFTDEAGMCLVTYLDYEGHKIIAILLNSPNRREEMKELLDYSLKTLGITPPLHL